MLKTIHIENIAVIERADVEFAPGLCVLSGETGAGKSIVIDSLTAVLGGRVSRELIRSGADSGRVTAVFDSRGAEEWCRENDIDREDELVLQRRLSADGKSAARVNGIPVSISQLRELGALLLDIHGQNDGRQLLDEKRHLAYLDAFGTDETALEAYRTAYGAWREIVREQEKLTMNEAEKERLEEALRHTVEELEKAGLRAGEEQELTERRELLRNSEKLTEFLDQAYAALYGGEDSAVSLCAEGEYAVERAGAWCPELLPATELIRNARMALEDAAERVREKQGELDFSPEEYDRMEERLSRLRRLQKKYGTDEEGLIALLEESRDRLDSLEYAEDRLLKLQKEAAAALKKAKSAGEELTRQRKAAGERLQALVERELRELSMPSVRFLTVVEPLEGKDGLSESGMDAVRFAMSANAGEEPGPISRIASGGELSRIMLALKNVFSARDRVETMVFDEIDTGVSGIAAQRVGEKLARLGRSKQVLCVTHLPQIAAMADEEYLVEKQERSGRTYTEIRHLDLDGRVRELARITGGDNASEAVLASARDLLEKAAEYRHSLS